MGAVSTLPCVHGLDADVVPCAMNDALPAFRAIGVPGCVSGHIPYVDVSKPLLKCGFVESLKGSHRGGREVFHQVGGVKPGKVNRDIRTEFPEDPPAECTNLFLRVVEGRQDEINDFQPNAFP